MAIENLDSEEIIQREVKARTTALIPIENAFQTSNVWLAGMLKIRSPFVDESMILYGFIGKYDEMNIDEFKVNGMTISFADEDGDYYNSKKYKIYPKVMADLKQSTWHELFPVLNFIGLTQPLLIGGYVHNTLNIDNHSLIKMNYYFFESNIHSEPSVASDEIYLVCKYKKEGKTQYALFAPHEVMLDNQ